MKKKRLTLLQLAKLAGKATFAKHGREHYSRMGKIRWEKWRARKAKEVKKVKAKV